MPFLFEKSKSETVIMSSATVDFDGCQFTLCSPHMPRAALEQQVLETFKFYEMQDSEKSSDHCLVVGNLAPLKYQQMHWQIDLNNQQFSLSEIEYPLVAKYLPTKNKPLNFKPLFEKLLSRAPKQTASEKSIYNLAYALIRNPKGDLARLYLQGLESLLDNDTRFSEKNINLAAIWLPVITAMLFKKPVTILIAPFDVSLREMWRVLHLTKLFTAYEQVARMVSLDAEPNRYVKRSSIAPVQRESIEAQDIVVEILSDGDADFTMKDFARVAPIVCVRSSDNGMVCDIDEGMLNALPGFVLTQPLLEVKLWYLALKNLEKKFLTPALTKLVSAIKIYIDNQTSHAEPVGEEDGEGLSSREVPPEPLLFSRLFTMTAEEYEDGKMYNEVFALLAPFIKCGEDSPFDYTSLDLSDYYELLFKPWVEHGSSEAWSGESFLVFGYALAYGLATKKPSLIAVYNQTSIQADVGEYEGSTRLLDTLLYLLLHYCEESKPEADWLKKHKQLIDSFDIWLQARIPQYQGTLLETFIDTWHQVYHHPSVQCYLDTHVLIWPEKFSHELTTEKNDLSFLIDRVYEGSIGGVAKQWLADAMTSAVMHQFYQVLSEKQPKHRKLLFQILLRLALLQTSAARAEQMLIIYYFASYLCGIDAETMIFEQINHSIKYGLMSREDFQTWFARIMEDEQAIDTLIGGATSDAMTVFLDRIQHYIDMQLAHIPVSVGPPFYPKSPVNKDIDWGVWHEMLTAKYLQPAHVSVEQRDFTKLTDFRFYFVPTPGVNRFDQRPTYCSQQTWRAALAVLALQSEKVSIPACNQSKQLNTEVTLQITKIILDLALVALQVGLVVPAKILTNSTADLLTTAPAYPQQFSSEDVKAAFYVLGGVLVWDTLTYATYKLLARKPVVADITNAITVALNIFALVYGAINTFTIADTLLNQALYFTGLIYASMLLLRLMLSKDVEMAKMVMHAMAPVILACCGARVKYYKHDIRHDRFHSRVYQTILYSALFLINPLLVSTALLLLPSSFGNLIHDMGNNYQAWLVRFTLKVLGNAISAVLSPLGAALTGLLIFAMLLHKRYHPSAAQWSGISLSMLPSLLALAVKFYQFETVTEAAVVDHAANTTTSAWVLTTLLNMTTTAGANSAGDDTFSVTNAMVWLALLVAFGGMGAVVVQAETAHSQHSPQSYNGFEPQRCSAPQCCERKSAASPVGGRARLLGDGRSPSRAIAYGTEETDTTQARLVKQIDGECDPSRLQTYHIRF